LCARSLSLKEEVPRRKKKRREGKERGERKDKRSKTAKFLFKSASPFIDHCIWAGLRDLPDAFLVLLEDEATTGNPSCVRSYRRKHKKLN